MGQQFTIEIGEPSIWSLEQAHYLLARMRAADQGLQNAPPSATDLDPNQIQGTRIQILQSMFSAEASFDQTAAVKNQAALKTFNSDFDRKQALRTRLDELNTQRLNVIKQLTDLNINLQKLTDQNAKKEELDIINAQITGKNAEKDLLDKQISSVQTEISGLTLTQPSFATPSLGSMPPLPSSAVSKLTAGTQPGVGAPKLHASTILDNYIQMQYEIISKQLTLLREEVGPDRRLVFLELPYSIYSKPTKENKSLVQIDWTVLGFCNNTQELKNITKKRLKLKRANAEKPPQVDEEQENNRRREREGPYSPATLDLFTEQPNSQQANADRPQQEEEKRESKWIKQQEAPYSRDDVLNLLAKTPDACPVIKFQDPAKTQDQNVRVVDLIPRQSALNINQTYDTVKGWALSAHFLELFGLGGRVDYQRQRETYEQFVHQDAFTTGHGKGTTKFGWTFGPLPGSRQIAPGVRTTYAILIVPKDAVAIQLEATGFGFPRKDLPHLPKNASEIKNVSQGSFLVIVPPTAEGFYVESADYTPTTAGNFVTLYLRGTYFSPQIGVLVNGIPLQRVVGIAQQDLNSQNPPPSPGGTSPIHGQFEQVNQETLAMAFTMGSAFQGTPTISLVTPEKAVDIMYYELCINEFDIDCPETDKETLFRRGQREPMFSSPLGLTGLKVLNPDAKSKTVRTLLTGTGFREQGDKKKVITTLLVNGTRLQEKPKGDDLKANEFRFLSSTEYDLNLAPANDPTFDIVIAQEKGGIRTEASPLSIPNPFKPQASQIEIISDIPKSNTVPEEIMQVHLQGTGLNLVTNVEYISGARNIPDFKLVSATDLILTIHAPSEPITAILDGPAAANATFVTIKRPQAPHIISILNPDTKSATGPKAGGYRVNIHGTNLQGVTEVLFGSNAGPIQSGSSDTDLYVLAPAGNTGPVAVKLNTNIVYLGRKLDNSADLNLPSSTFTYTEK